MTICGRQRHSEFRSARRYYLLSAQSASLNPLGIEADLYRKQIEEPGTALPVDFPQLTKLTAAHYTTTEDLTGAGTQELVQQVGLTISQAEAVLTALAAL